MVKQVIKDSLDKLYRLKRDNQEAYLRKKQLGKKIKDSAKKVLLGMLILNIFFINNYPLGEEGKIKYESLKEYALSQRNDNMLNINIDGLAETLEGKNVKAAITLYDNVQNKAGIKKFINAFILSIGLEPGHIIFNSLSDTQYEIIFLNFTKSDMNKLLSILINIDNRGNVDILYSSKNII